MKRLLVLASGEGTTFEAIARAVQSQQLKNTCIVALGSNKRKAGALLRAQTLGIESFVIESKKFRTAEGKWDRASYEQTLGDKIDSLKPDFICLAGYMLILGSEFVNRFPMKIINIHPSLLPKFRGLHAIEQALAASETETGCTVHFVNEELDAGPIIKQARIPILPNDTALTVRERIRPVEHETYVTSLRMVCEKPFQLSNGQLLFQD